MRELLREKARVDGMRDECMRREAESREAYRAASEAEQAAERAYKFGSGNFKLQAPYKTAKEKEWAADADPKIDNLKEAWGACVTLRREMNAAQEMAVRACSLVEAEYKALAAAFHAYNRELKVELDLAGRST
jgi:hypothetical protein